MLVLCLFPIVVDVVVCSRLLLMSALLFGCRCSAVAGICWCWRLLLFVAVDVDACRVFELLLAVPWLFVARVCYRLWLVCVNDVDHLVAAFGDCCCALWSDVVALAVVCGTLCLSSCVVRCCSLLFAVVCSCLLFWCRC